MSKKNEKKNTEDVKKNVKKESPKAYSKRLTKDDPKKESSKVTKKEKPKTTKKEVVEKKVDISPFISNPKGNIYAVAGLPEEFIATMFAWVSRSDKSFKEHLVNAIEEFDIKIPKENHFKELDAKAKSFHEKWTVGYGHSSVAEHAIAHVGIEKVSRLASAELELSNTFLSITEYSQRYQQPKRGGWHNPFDKKDPLHEDFEAFMNNCFDTFESLIKKLHKYLDSKIPKGTSAANKRKMSNANLKLAFEDARYVLPMSVHTQLGMTANGRAWRDGLAALGTSKHQEVYDMKESLKKEISTVLPVLLKYADPSAYQLNSVKNKIVIPSLMNHSDDKKSYVSVLNVEGELGVMKKIAALLIVENNNVPYNVAMQTANNISKEELTKMINTILMGMEHFDVPPESFKHINYQAEFFISEANWHQLLRHNRKTNFIFNAPSVMNGYITPPMIKEAGCEEEYLEAIEESERMFKGIMHVADNKVNAEYVVLNAHKRRIVADFNLWEAYHLINLRTSVEAQWEIRDTFQELYEALLTVQPVLFSKAKRRLK